MNFTDIIIASAVVGGVGLLVGLILGIAGDKFKVTVDERVEKLRIALPGNNCGGCGYPGCDGFARAVAEGKAPVNGCPVGGAKTAEKIAEIMGVKSDSPTEKKVAFVRCAGDRSNTRQNYVYDGPMDCQAAYLSPGHGSKMCSYGCMGLATCAKACPFDAIRMVDGLAVVDKEKCTACGICVAACPKNLIELIPYDSKYAVRCSSHEKGKKVKEACDVGCIGCGICAKVCPTEAITVSDNLAHIDQQKCIRCGKCAEKCPTKIIRTLR